MEAPKTSPVAHLKFFLAINAIKTPDNKPAIIPIIPRVLKAKNPTADVRMNDSKQHFFVHGFDKKSTGSVWKWF